MFSQQRNRNELKEMTKLKNIILIISMFLLSLFALIGCSNNPVTHNNKGITEKDPIYSTVAFDEDTSRIDIKEEDLGILKGYPSALKKANASIAINIKNEILLKYFAQILAKSLLHKGISNIIHDKIGEQFDGDFNLLWEHIKDAKFSNVTVKDLVNSRFSNEALKLLNINIIELVDLLQISCPENFEKWDPNTPILVAFEIQTQNDIDVETIKAYDSNGKEYIIDGKNATTYPVIVVGISERVDRITRKIIQYGNVQPNFELNRLTPEIPDSEIKSSANGLKKPRSLAKRMESKSFSAIYLTNFHCSDDKEPWWKGKAEVFVTALTDANRTLHYEVKDGVKKNRWYALDQFWLYRAKDMGRYLSIEFYEDDANSNNDTRKLTINASQELKNVIKDTTLQKYTPDLKIEASFAVDDNDDPMGKIETVDLSGDPLNSVKTDHNIYYRAGVTEFTLWWDNKVDYIIPALNPEGEQILQGNSTNDADDWDVDGSDGKDICFFMDVRTAVSFDATTCVPIPSQPGKSYTNYDSKIQIFTVDGPTAMYNDDAFINPCSVNTLASELVNAYLTPGFYWLVVDGYNGNYGEFRLKISNVKYH